MKEKQRLIRNIATLRESINRDRDDLFSQSPFTHAERTAIRAHIEQSVQDLKEWTRRLDQLPPGSN